MGDFGTNPKEVQVITDVRRIAVALEALVNVAEWYTSGDTTTLDALANKQDDMERRMVKLEAAHEAIR